VQDWFNALSVEAQEEISDLLGKLQNVTERLWRKPEFDPLEGAGGISEIRPNDIRGDAGSLTYRIYGFFGPGNREYTLLHGVRKTVKNDHDGKRIARNRLVAISEKRATIHEFDFSGDVDSKTPERTRGES
jgi:hypothetical protein